MSRLNLLDTVRVLPTCPNEFYRGKQGVIVDGSRVWSAWHVEIVIDGVTYRPLIAASQLQKIAQCAYPGCTEPANIECCMIGCTHKVCETHGNGGIEEAGEQFFPLCWQCDGKGWGE